MTQETQFPDRSNDRDFLAIQVRNEIVKGKTLQEVAKAMAISIDSVRVLDARGKRLLKSN